MPSTTCSSGGPEVRASVASSVASGNRSTSSTCACTVLVAPGKSTTTDAVSIRAVIRGVGSSVTRACQVLNVIRCSAPKTSVPKISKRERFGSIR